MAQERVAQNNKWSVHRLVDVAPIQKPGVSRFSGFRPYVATADVEGWTIKSSKPIQYDARPLRANVEPRAGDVLLARMKDTFKLVLLTHDIEGTIFSTGFVNFRPRREILLPSFLFYWLMSPQIQRLKDALCTGETQKAISNGEIRTHFKVPLPSLSEQESTVVRCDKIRTVIERLTLQGTATQRLIRKLRETLFSQIEDLSTLEKVTKLIYRYPSFYGFKYRKEGVPVVKIEKMTPEGNLDPDADNYERIPIDVNVKYPKTILQAGDLVMGVRGTYIGLSALVPKNLEGSNMSPNLVRIEPNRNKIMPEFLWNYLQTRQCRDEINTITNFWKVGFGTIKSEELKDRRVPLPDMSVQEKICRILDRVLAAHESINANISSARKLMIAYVARILAPVGQVAESS